MDLRKNFEFEEVLLISFVNLNNEEREIIREWRNHEDVKKWMYTDHIISPEEHSIFIDRLINDNKNFFWLGKNKNEGYLGVISLNRVDFKNRNSYLGIYSSPEQSGIGGLLIECLKKLAFDTVHLHTLKAEVIEANERAINFYKKSGFVEEGRLKEFVFKDSRWLDVIILGIINRGRE